ncbi:MAG: hypothetical protein J6575_08745, partial [Bifidobacterium sp.]|nr:hypothetical protein [Bifidobacterium sp.]
NIASFSKGRGFSKMDLLPVGKEIILYGLLYTDYRLQYFKSNQHVSSSKKGVISKVNDIITPASGETADEIAIASVIKTAGILIGSDLNIVRADSQLCIPEFIAIEITETPIHFHLAAMAQGKSIVHIHNDDLMKLKLSLPTKNEQTEIVTLLGLIEDMIANNNRKISQLKICKQAYLQQLLI